MRLKTTEPLLFSRTITSKNCSIPPSKPGLQESRKCSADGLMVVQLATGSGATAIKKCNFKMNQKSAPERYTPFLALFHRTFFLPWKIWLGFCFLPFSFKIESGRKTRFCLKIESGRKTTFSLKIESGNSGPLCHVWLILMKDKKLFAGAYVR